jgi:DNA-directed RNA polymerase subunit RPC12/RpoP
MSEIRAFVRSCPACGHRFHIRIVGKKEVQDQRLRSEGKSSGMVMSESAGAPPQELWMPVVVEEGKPIEVELKDFAYTYKCKHCGHEWMEKHTEEHIS